MADIEAELTEIPASEILDKIQKGDPVEYDHARIIGNLDVGKLDLPIKHVESSEFAKIILRLSEEYKVITSSIKIINSTFDSKIDFRNTIFENKIDFSDTTFGKDANFRDATFSKDANFCDATFSGCADFSDATFSKDALFSYATFSKDATFREGACFTGVTFSGCADFVGATFREGALFGAISLRGTAFRGATFSKYAYFDDVTFCEDANFSYATFSEDAYFGGATFSGIAYFNRSRFDNIVDFNANFCKRINLDESKIYSMHLSKAIFENASTISLRFSDIARLEVRWKSIRDKIEYDGAAYLLLVKNFNNLELFNDSDECYYQYRTVRRKDHLGGILPKLLDYVAWIAYGYGVRPRNPLILSLGLFLISIIVFALGFGLQEPLGSVINATYLSVFVFTSSPKTDPLTGLYGIWGMIERIAGWLLMACFLVVLAKKTLR